MAAIYINKTSSDHSSFELEPWLVPGISRVHEGAWPLMLDLYEEGWVSDAEVKRLRIALLDGGEGEEKLESAAQDGVDAGFLEPATASAFRE